LEVTMTDGSPLLRGRTSRWAAWPLGRFNTIDRAATVRQAAQLRVRLGVSTEFTAATIDQFNF
jgi:hypothetical protein